MLIVTYLLKIFKPKIFIDREITTREPILNTNSYGYITPISINPVYHLFIGNLQILNFISS